MECCNQNGDCRQGRDCPIRTCRQRAGKPADYEIWSEIKISPTQEQLEEWERQDRSDRLATVFLVAVIMTLILTIILVSLKR